MDNLEKEMAKVFSIMGKTFGFNDLCTNVLSVLYLSIEDISLDEIAKKTGYSLASISNTMKILEQIGIATKSRKPGSKKNYYYMEKNMLKLNIQKITKASENYIIPAKDMLPEIIGKYKKKAKLEKDKKKLELIENYFEQIKNFEKILNKWKQDLENLK